MKAEDVARRIQDNPYDDNAAQWIQEYADSQTAELRAENEKLRAVRDYYANPENWRYGRFVSDGRTTIKDDDMYDLLTSSAEKYDSSGGRLARISLEAEHGE